MNMHNKQILCTTHKNIHVQNIMHTYQDEKLSFVST